MTGDPTIRKRLRELADGVRYAGGNGTSDYWRGFNDGIDRLLDDPAIDFVWEQIGSARAALIDPANTKERTMTYRDLLLEFIAWCVDNPPEAIFEDGDAATDAVDAFLKATDPTKDHRQAHPVETAVRGSEAWKADLRAARDATKRRERDPRQR